MNRFSRLLYRLRMARFKRPAQPKKSSPFTPQAHVCTEPLESRRLLASITGTVFLDANLNLGRDKSEPVLSGWTVYLDQNHNHLLDAGEATANTDANGHYTFTSLAPGTYQVDELVMTGWRPTS